MADYSFVTRWRLPAPIGDVFEAIWRSAEWPSWWQHVQSVVELEKGDAAGVGSLRRYGWSTPLGYTLSFDLRTTRVERPTLLEGRAEGELAGVGRWRLAEEGGVTSVRYDWNVRTTKPWMNLLAPVARPLFRWNHDRVMASGGAGLARRLGVPLLDAEE